MPDRLALERNPRAWLVQAVTLGRAADLVGAQFQGEFQGWFLGEASRVLASGYEPSEDDIERRLRATELALPAYMLIGYAIEVALKGLIAARDGTDQAITWMTRNHLSIELVQRAQVTLSADEQQLVEKQLYHAVWWSGRYPTPSSRHAKTFEAQIEEARAQGYFPSDPRAVSTDHYRAARVLLDRLVNDLEVEVAADQQRRLNR